ncbi:MAG: hypothetical protein FJX03_01490, partial [Alphaproteobacteria bacterium]|nr:hypothetical protein [Alphaproteobacteria bacterium]
MNKYAKYFGSILFIFSSIFLSGETQGSSSLMGMNDPSLSGYNDGSSYDSSYDSSYSDPDSQYGVDPSGLGMDNSLSGQLGMGGMDPYGTGQSSYMDPSQQYPQPTPAPMPYPPQPQMQQYPQQVAAPPPLPMSQPNMAAQSTAAPATAGGSDAAALFGTIGSIANTNTTANANVATTALTTGATTAQAKAAQNYGLASQNMGMQQALTQQAMTNQYNANMMNRSPYMGGMSYGNPMQFGGQMGAMPYGNQMSYGNPMNNSQAGFSAQGRVGFNTQGSQIQIPQSNFGQQFSPQQTQTPQFQTQQPPALQMPAQQSFVQQTPIQQSPVVEPQSSNLGQPDAAIVPSTVVPPPLPRAKRKKSDKLAAADPSVSTAAGEPATAAKSLVKPTDQDLQAEIAKRAKKKSDATNPSAETANAPIAPTPPPLPAKKKKSGKLAAADPSVSTAAGEPATAAKSLVKPTDQDLQAEIAKRAKKKSDATNLSAEAANASVVEAPIAPPPLPAKKKKSGKLAAADPSVSTAAGEPATAAKSLVKP